jgi:peptidoglycan hydrolase-like protein with peptidoglycan-binding domain
MPATAKAVVAEALKHVGVVEKPANSNRTPFGKWFGADGVAWCAMFVSYVFAHAGAPEMLKGAQTAKGSAIVSKIKLHLKKRGAKEIKPADAMPGDVVIFDFPGGYETDHVGIIRAKSNAAKKQIFTVEGNTSSGAAGSQANGGGVYKRTRSFGTVESIWRPNYVAEVVTPVAPVVVPATAVSPIEPVAAPTAVTAQPAAPAVAVVEPKTLAHGSKGAEVKKLQAALKITADGIFGNQTEAAVKAFQLKKGIVVTGKADAETLKRLYK